MWNPVGARHAVPSVELEMKYDPQTHHRRSLRLPQYDYSDPGAYFITVCAKRRQCVLAEIKGGESVPSEFGKVVLDVWKDLPARYENVQTDAFVVMPNHLHGIIVVTSVGAVHEPPARRAIHELPLQSPRMRRQMLIPRCVGYLKMNSARMINETLGTSGTSVWQRGYYERVIRNEDELARIRQYIAENPVTWELDRENPLSRNFNLDHGEYFKGIYV